MQLTMFLIKENGQEYKKDLVEVFGSYSYDISAWENKQLHLVKHGSDPGGDNTKWGKIHYTIINIIDGSVILQQNVESPNLPQDQPNDPYRLLHRSYSKVIDLNNPCLGLADTTYKIWYSDKIFDFNPAQNPEVITGGFANWIKENPVIEATNLKYNLRETLGIDPTNANTCLVSSPVERKIKTLKSLRQLLNVPTGETVTANLVLFMVYEA